MVTAVLALAVRSSGVPAEGPRPTAQVPAGPAHGMPASPHPFEGFQPDGTRVELRLRGDFTFHWLEDLDGFTVIKDRDTFVYAALDRQGRLFPTAHAVGKVEPRRVGLPRRALPAREIREEAARALAKGPGPRMAGRTTAPAGRIKNLVILMRFADHAERLLPSAEDMSVLFNAPGGDSRMAPTGSVRDFYLQNSYGAMSLESTVVGWITLPQSERYYAGGSSGLSYRIHEAIRTALERADPLVDFGRFDDDRDGSIDAITFIHSGYGAEFGADDQYGVSYVDRIWSHRWEIPVWTSSEGVSVSDYHISPGLWGVAGSEPGRIGVICHETGHFFGLPDLYDTDGGGEGIGSYSLMANSWGFDGTQLHPPHFCAWSKVELGWVQPITIRQPGTYSVPKAETDPVIYRIDRGFPDGEYLLIENRQPAGFETDLPQGGLCVFHIDERANFDGEGYPGQYGWPENGLHYRVALLQADGLYQLERGFGRGDGGDVYHAGGAARLGHDTTPGTDAYQGGQTADTGNRIEDISASGPVMTFRFSTSGPGRSGRFRRGDSDGDGTLDLTDAFSILNRLFLSGPPPGCPDALDVNDSGDLDLTDAISLLGWLFLSGDAPSAPGPTCGLDPTWDGLPDCLQTACP